MEQPHLQRQQSYLDAINRPGSDGISTATIWNNLDPNLQLQLTQCLAELIHRIRKTVTASEKEDTDEA